MTNLDLVLKKSSEYELLDCGTGRKLERFGKYTLIRPEKQAMWKETSPELWDNADAEYTKTNEKNGEWILKNPEMPRGWEFECSDFKLLLKLTPFGHVGIFPDQSENWDWIKKQCEEKPLKVLSLFSYTGGATLAAASVGAILTHVDASKPAISWAVENQKLSGLEQKSIRWILDDALKFVKREERRENKYDGIIMDPPKFGRGPKGEVWQFEKNFPELLKSCKQILSNDPAFFLVTAYTVPISPITLASMVSDILPSKENVEYGELVIEDGAGRMLPTALYTRWSKN